MEANVNDRDEFLQKFSDRIDDILAICNELDIICRLDRFKLWMKRYHAKVPVGDILIGYQFAFHIIARRLFDVVSQNSSLKLSTDLIFMRADFRGTEIHLLPNSCEKTILLKNIKVQIKDVMSSTTLAELGRTLSQFAEAIVSPLQQLKLVSTLANNSVLGSATLDELINYCSMNDLLIFLNDTERGVPHGYPVPTLNSDIWDNPSKKNEYLLKAFKGYKYSILFIWSTLLNINNYESFKELYHSRSWRDFDRNFDGILKQIIQPLELKLRISLGLSPVITINGDAKHLLQGILQNNHPAPKLSEREILEQIFLWYQIQVIDASEYTKFNGLPALYRLLMGSQQFKNKNHIAEMISVVKLIHPYSSRGNDYSYAIFIEFGSASGWLLFLNCAYDYTVQALLRMKISKKCFLNMKRRN
ncbi:MAG: hypothetical protein Q7R50_01935 [Dehalococcoidales bacterium]|nr:hypothetical protein [Dehalococcoidales bacterium]